MAEIDITPRSVLIRTVADALVKRMAEDTHDQHTWQTLADVAAESPYLAGEINDQAAVAVDALTAAANAPAKMAAEVYRAKRIAWVSTANNGQDTKAAQTQMIQAADELCTAVLNG